MIADMIDRIMYDTNCSLEIALQWAVNAKNSLQTVHGFSPATLVFGYNPRLPSVFVDKPPAVSNSKYTEIVEEHLKVMRRARTAFLQAESSERIRRALNKRIRTSCEARYITGDTVYFKRKDERAWKGPAKIIGQDGCMVLIRYQSTWVRVHPSRVIHADIADDQLEKSSENNESIQPTQNTENGDEDMLCPPEPFPVDNVHEEPDNYPGNFELNDPESDVESVGEPDVMKL